MLQHYDFWCISNCGCLNNAVRVNNSYIMKLDTGDTKNFETKSTLYQEFLAEREEILKHKWIESEKFGNDVGFEVALRDWIRNYRDGWRAARGKTKAS